jgi:hypothetical protein
MGYIQLGRYNKYYKYIIFQVICNLLYHFTFGLHYGSVYTQIYFFENPQNGKPAGGIFTVESSSVKWYDVV